MDETPGSLTGRQVGNYSATRLLGKGSMGEVYEGKHPILDKRVAIKILSPELSQYPELVSRFRREARAIARIKHKAIVEAFDFGNLSDGRCYYVMEYLQGTNLATYMQAKGALPIDESIDIALPLMEGMAAAHEAGFIHRDIKPDNIFLIKTEEGKLFPKLIDFGIAKLRNPDEQGDSVVTRIDAVMGTPLYMSPEQAPGSTETVGAWSDIYSTAATLYHVMSGKPPFYSDNPLELMLMHSWSPPPPLHEVRPEVPLPVSNVIMKALSKKPDERYPNMTAFAEALRAAYEGRPTEAAAAAYDDTVMDGMPLNEVSGVQETQGAEGSPGATAATSSAVDTGPTAGAPPVGDTAVPITEDAAPTTEVTADRSSSASLEAADAEEPAAPEPAEPPTLENDQSAGSVTSSLSGMATEKVIDAAPPDATLFRRKKSPWPWVGGGGGVVAAAVLAFVLLRGHGEAASSEVTWSQVASSTRHTCAIRRGDGSVWCWGRNNYGQVGNGTRDRVSRPVRVKGIKKARQVSAGGRHSCAVTAGGKVLCWGKNAHGQLGDGTRTDRSEAVPVAGLAAASAVAAGADHTCALLEDANVRCWGRNDSGQLGTGKTSAPQPKPVAVRDLMAVIGITAGGYHSCALSANGSAWCWGKNDVGQLGSGSRELHAQPVKVAGLKDATLLTAGGAHTCALVKGGAVWCWGDNASGQLGIGSTTASSTPVKAKLGTAATSVAAGGGYLGGHTCAVTADYRLWCWGNNVAGQLGRDPAESKHQAPVRVTGLPGGVTGVATGGLHTCALERGGRLFCFGKNDDGQLGVGTFADHTTPMRVK